METPFNPAKLIGKWYELVRYRTWYELDCVYNTRAEYLDNLDGTFRIRNTTLVNGTEIASIGLGKHLQGNEFRVDFPLSEMISLQGKYEAALGIPIKLTPEAPATPSEQKTSNYIVEKTWECDVKGIMYMVITDSKRESMFVLSQWRNPSQAAYAEIMTYITQHFDITKVVQVPQYTKNKYCTKQGLKSYHADKKK